MELKYGYIDEKIVRDIVKEYGTPLYIFDSQSFINNYNRLLNAFRKIYAKYNIAYSYKTNYTPRVCQIVKQLGGFAEVVSNMEYQLARKIGYDCRHIIYNGPVKGEGLYEQLYEGGVVNVDNLDEMQIICQFAKENPAVNCRLAFRVNIDIKQSFISRFGIDAFNGDLQKAFTMSKRIKNIKVVGLHCHIGQSRSLQAWNNRVDIMLQLVEQYFEKTPEFIDLGSGMNSDMEPSLSEQFGDNIPTFEQYADIVAMQFAKKYGSLPYDEQPILFTEPGTTLISGYMSLITKVENIKYVRGKTYATFDSSSGNMGDICHLKQLPITVYPFGTNKISVENADFVGYTCLEHDVMYRNYSGNLAVGDIVQFRNIGSYSNVFKPPFISPNCAMIELDKNNNVKVLKRKEMFNDIFDTYIFT